jgi:hypothetical protein
MVCVPYGHWQSTGLYLSMKYLKKNWDKLSLFFIILLSVILRFVRYPDRWGLAYDQAHDAIIAHHAISTFQLPLLGPFSSAGPYQTGGEWYWFIMFGTILYPFSVITPWIVMTLLYVFFVYLMIQVGTELVERKFGFLVGLLAAISPAQITQGTNLTNQSPIAVIGLLSIWCSVRYLRKKERRYIFLLALLVGLGSSIHLQGVALGILLVVTVIFAKRFDIKTIFVVFLGLLILWTPVIIVDIQNHFFNSKGMLQYYLHDQYNISLDVLGRRWKTYAGVFWPKMWSFVIGGESILGYVITIGLLIVAGYQIVTRKIAKEWLVLLLSVAGMITLLRYTRTPLFDSYIVFLHPFILLLTAWLLYWLYQQRKLFGYIALGIIFLISLQRDIKEINASTNRTGKASTLWKDHLLKTFPGKSFAIYDYKNDTRDKSVPLILFLQSHNKKMQETMRIGMIATDAGYIKQPIIYGKDDGTKLVNLEKVSITQLKKDGWILTDPQSIYEATEHWYKNK